MSEPSRIAGVYFSPGKAFRDIAARPRWVAPLLLTILAGMAYIYMFNQRIGWEHFMRQTIENSSRASQLTPEQKEKAIEMQMKIAPIAAFAGVLLFGPVYGLVASAVLLFVFNSMMGAQMKYRQMFSIMCYAGLTGVVGSALAIVVMFLKSPEDFNLQNPLAFNPGAFLDPLQTSKFVYSLAGSFDLFSFWTMALIAIGVTAAGRKMTFGKAFAGVLIPWAVVVVGKAGFAGLFG